MKQINEFDRYIKNYRQNLSSSLFLSGETSEFFAQYKAETLKNWFPKLVNQPISILDYGCGDGLMTSYTQKYFTKAKVYGVDISTDSISYATQKYPDIIFSTIENKTISHTTNKFDLVYAAGVFHHIPKEKQQISLDEIMRVLKPGGQFILFELNPRNPLTQLTFKRCPIDRDAVMFSPHKAKKMIQQYGKTKTKYYCFFPAPLKRLRPFEKFLYWLPLGALYACIVTKEKVHNEKI